MAYKENLNRFIEMYGVKMSVMFDIDQATNAEHSEVYLKSVNNVPAHIINESDVQKIEDEIKLHEANLQKESCEYKYEMLSDESRGN